MFEIFSNFLRNEDWAKLMFNSSPRSFNCLHTESADFCSLNGRMICTDCRSGVDLRGSAGVCLDVIKLEIIE